LFQGAQKASLLKARRPSVANPQLARDRQVRADAKRKHVRNNYGSIALSGVDKKSDHVAIQARLFQSACDQLAYIKISNHNTIAAYAGNCIQ
jgi:hypothetical protein